MLCLNPLIPKDEQGSVRDGHPSGILDSSNRAMPRGQVEKCHAESARGLRQASGI